MDNKNVVCLAKRKNRKRKEICIKIKIEMLGYSFLKD